jgi:hypothetical protein
LGFIYQKSSQTYLKQLSLGIFLQNPQKVEFGQLNAKIQYYPLPVFLKVTKIESSIPINFFLTSSGFCW